MTNLPKGTEHDWPEVDANRSTVISEINTYFARKKLMPQQVGFKGCPLPPMSVAEQLLLGALQALNNHELKGK